MGSGDRVGQLGHRCRDALLCRLPAALQPHRHAEACLAGGCPGHCSHRACSDWPGRLLRLGSRRRLRPVAPPPRVPLRHSCLSRLQGTSRDAAEQGSALRHGAAGHRRHRADRADARQCTRSSIPGYRLGSVRRHLCRVASWHVIVAAVGGGQPRYNVPRSGQLLALSGPSHRHCAAHTGVPTYPGVSTPNGSGLSCLRSADSWHRHSIGTAWLSLH